MFYQSTASSGSWWNLQRLLPHPIIISDSVSSRNKLKENILHIFNHFNLHIWGTFLRLAASDDTAFEILWSKKHSVLKAISDFFCWRILYRLRLTWLPSIWNWLISLVWENSSFSLFLLCWCGKLVDIRQVGTTEDRKGWILPIILHVCDIGERSRWWLFAGVPYTPMRQLYI